MPEYIVPKNSIFEIREVTADHIRIAGKLVAIDDTIKIIRAHRTPKSWLFHENETARVIRYLENLKDEIVGAVVR
jgi:hypothetical protein